MNEQIVELPTPTKKMLSPRETDLLEIIKARPISTEEIMERYSMTRLQVRLLIKTIRRSGAKVNNYKNIIYKNKRCQGYSVEGYNLMQSRLRSTMITCLEQDPNALGMIYSVANEYKKLYKK